MFNVGRIRILIRIRINKYESGTLVDYKVVFRIRIRIRIRRIYMSLGHPDPNPDPLVRDTDLDHSIIKKK
jgi:hypothetical protein